MKIGSESGPTYPNNLGLNITEKYDILHFRICAGNSAPLPIEFARMQMKLKFRVTRDTRETKTKHAVKKLKKWKVWRNKNKLVEWIGSRPPWQVVYTRGQWLRRGLAGMCSILMNLGKLKWLCWQMCVLRMKEIDDIFNQGLWCD